MCIRDRFINGYEYFRVLTNIFCFRNILVRLFHLFWQRFRKDDISEKEIGKIEYPLSNKRKHYIFVHQENGKNHISCSDIILESAFETAPKHIKKFCGDRIIVTEKVVDDLEEAAKLAIKGISIICIVKLRLQLQL